MDALSYPHNPCNACRLCGVAGISCSFFRPAICRQPRQFRRGATAEAPQPQIAMADDPAIGYTIEQAPAAPAAPAPAQGSSSSQSGMQQPEAEKSQHEKAEEQIKEQEKQRVVGVLPQFNISYRADAVSMTGSQKLRLAFRSAVDPVAFGVAVVAAGYREALDDDPGFGWGPEGFGKRGGSGLSRRVRRRDYRQRHSARATAPGPPLLSARAWNSEPPPALFPGRPM